MPNVIPAFLILVIFFSLWVLPLSHWHRTPVQVCTPAPSPAYPTNCFAFSKREMSPMAARTVIATTKPTPGSCISCKACLPQVGPVLWRSNSSSTATFNLSTSFNSTSSWRICIFSKTEMFSCLCHHLSCKSPSSGSSRLCLCSRLCRRLRITLAPHCKCRCRCGCHQPASI